MEPPRKRARLENHDDVAESTDHSLPVSLTRPISPVGTRSHQASELPVAAAAAPSISPELNTSNTMPSPFQLTAIHDLPTESNVDAVTLTDILGDPLIAECWEFNYLHDLDFLMNAFDEDVRSLVKVHVVHGFWKQEDPSRHRLQLQASAYKNVTLHSAFLPEMFGTHHSKMMILLRHDDAAQVIIHTANMIPRDWKNMTQAVWRSPPLPLLRDGESEGDGLLRVGSGEKFKADLLSYLRAYDRRRITCKPITDALAKYNFSSVKGTLIASVPGRHNIRDDESPRWGWAAMKQALRAIPVQEGKAEIVIQISSIATLGPTDNWLRNTLFSALGSHRGAASQKPGFKVVFPTADEIRRSLDGYASGASIHTKIQSSQQAKQLQYLKPIFCHWANDARDGSKLADNVTVRDGGRKRAAPHIKTYIRYGGESIDWALVTSANLSKQAWGEAGNNAGEMRISSYEIGVLVWPSLYAEDANMVPTFLTDNPAVDSIEGARTIIGLRIPYNLPLQSYGKDEIPWVASADHGELDWMGNAWGN